MRTRVMTAALALVLGLTVLAGCSDNSNQYARVVCEAELVNAGVPLISAYIDVGGDGAVGGTDDSYPIDAVPILFRARPYSMATMTIPENDVFSWFHITRYNLTWVPGPTAPAALTDFNVTDGAFELIVPVNDEAVSSVMIADRSLKEAHLSALLPANDFTAVARLEFFGTETGSKHEIMIPVGVYVTFTYAIVTE